MYSLSRSKRSYSLVRLNGTVAALIAMTLLTGCAPADTDNRVLLTLDEAAPPIEVQTLGGATWKLSASTDRGNAVAVFFLASWCPCTKESLTYIRSAHELYAARGIDFIAIATQDKERKFRKFMEAEALPFPAAFDHDDIVARSHRIKAPPSVVLIAPDGTLKRAHYGNIKDVKDEFNGWFELLIENLKEDLINDETK